MKKLIVGLIILIGANFTVTQSYVDIDKSLLVTSIIVDKTEDDAYSVYFEGVSPVTSTSGTQQVGDKTIIHVESKNFEDIINTANSQSKLRLNLTQDRIILFTEKAAEKGIADILNLFTTPQEIVIRAYICIWGDNPEKIYELNLAGEKFLGVSLTSQLENITIISSNTNLKTLRDLYNDMCIGSRVSIIPISKIIKHANDTTLDLQESAIIKDYKLVGRLTGPQTLYTNFLLDKIKNTVIRGQNPVDEEKEIALKVLKSQTKTKLSYSNGNFNITKDIFIRSTVYGSQNKSNITNENLKKIAESAEENLKQECIEVFDNNKNEGIDLLNIKEAFYRAYPKYSRENILENTNLNVNVKIAINKPSKDPMNVDYYIE